MIWSVFLNWVTTHEMPTRIKALFRDLIAFRKNASNSIAFDKDVSGRNREQSGFLKVYYHI